MDKRLFAAAMALASRARKLGARVPAPLRRWSQSTSAGLRKQMTARLPRFAGLVVAGVDRLSEWWKEETPDTAAERWPSSAAAVSGHPEKSAAADSTPVERTTDDWLAQLQTAESFGDRVTAAQRLAGEASPAVVSALTIALRDRSVEVACAAARSLGQLGRNDTAAQRALWSAFDNTEGYFSAWVRAAALSALGACLPEQELAGVFRGIQDNDAEVSVAAIGVALERVPEQTPRYVIPVLADDLGYYLPIVRLAAARALERSATVGDAALADLLQREQDPEVRAVLRRIVGGTRATRTATN